jgi:hypothetical protein
MAGKKVMAGKVYVQVDEYNNVIDCIRGEGFSFPEGENWVDITDEEEATDLTIPHVQRRTKVIKGLRKSRGTKKKNTIQKKPELRMKANSYHIKAGAEEGSIIRIDIVEDKRYERPIKLQINGETHTVMTEEDLNITAGKPMRIGIKCIDPDVMISPRVIFIQASTNGPKK